MDHRRGKVHTEELGGGMFPLMVETTPRRRRPTPRRDAWKEAGGCALSSRGVPGDRGQSPHRDQRSGAASGTALAGFDPGEKVRRRSGRFGSGSLKDLAAECQLPCLGSIGEEAKMPDAHESRGQDVEQEPADEFLSNQRHGLPVARVLSVPVGKSDVLCFDIENPVIGDSGAVGVAAQVSKNRFG